jgi:hypothetical protein
MRRLMEEGVFQRSLGVRKEDLVGISLCSVTALTMSNYKHYPLRETTVLLSP